MRTSNLERVVIEHEIESPECPHCGSEMAEMKVEVTEVIRLVPAHLVVEEHRRHVYKCKPCCSANAAGGEVASQIVRAPMPALTPIPGSFATASMLSYVINAKYANSTPYYRLEADFLTLGAEVSRQDMANWTINAHERWLSLIHARMKEKLLECRYLNCDESIGSSGIEGTRQGGQAEVLHVAVQERPARDAQLRVRVPPDPLGVGSARVPSELGRTRTRYPGAKPRGCANNDFRFDICSGSEGSSLRTRRRITQCNSSSTSGSCQARCRDVSARILNRHNRR